MRIEKLIELSVLAKRQGESEKLKRDAFEVLASHKDKVYLGLLGARGVGKTVLLKQLHAEDEDSIYISLDTLDRETDLFELIKDLSLIYQYKSFYLDEIHFVEEINKHLKNIFDFLDVKIIFTSSASLNLIKSTHDLSRRVKLMTLDPFSFQEFLRFNKLPTPEKLSLEDILSRNFSSEHINTMPYFEKYLKGGNYPISLDVKDIKSALQNNLNKIILSDIPRLEKLLVHELEIIKKCVSFIAKSSVSDINPTTIASNVKITRYKAGRYLEMLENSFIVKQIYPAGTNVMKEPKVLLTLPYRLLEHNFETAIGGLREDFAVGCLSSAGIRFHYLKSTRGEKTPDFLIEHKAEKLVIEIGGSSKSFKQFKGISSEFRRLVFADNPKNQNQLPLILLGFLKE
jgi:uncharacterized protein